MSRRMSLIVVTAMVVAAGAWYATARARPAGGGPRADPPTFARRMLWTALQPVTLARCDLRRFGEGNDGGYLLCANLLDGIAAGYSCGISGYDGWGCAVATTLDVPVHQYDCFNTTRPACPGRTVFHEACIGSEPAIVDGRVFDTLARQLAANSDGAARVVVKMDVEGAEWDAFLTAPDETLARIDQLVVEFHGTDERRFLSAVHRLSQYFHVANLHMNNHACDPSRAPFPAWAYEVLFVTRRLDQATGAGPARWPHPLDAPNALDVADCQAPPAP